MAVKVQHIRPFRSARQVYLAPALIVCSLLCCATYIYVGKELPRALPERSVVVAEYDTIKVPVPVREVSPGTPISAIELRYADIPRHQLPPDVIKDLSSISSLVTIGTLPASVPLMRSSFTKTDGTSNAVIERIPPGMRAMTLHVDETAVVEGWASSGAIVDVLLVQNDRTSVVAERVKILSTERSTEPNNGGTHEAPEVPKTVTVLVTQEQCLAISTALTHGKIAFALRSNRDDESWGTRSYLAERLKDGGALGAESPKKIGGFFTVGEKKYALIDDRWVVADSIQTPFVPTPVDQLPVEMP